MRCVEGVTMIIWCWFQLRRGGGLMSSIDFIRSWREGRKRQIVTSTVREEIECTKGWVILYFSTG